MGFTTFAKHLSDSAGKLILRNLSLGSDINVDFPSSSGRLALGLDLAGSTSQGRLTLTTGTDITTADVTAATTVYLTPSRGNAEWVYDSNGIWVPRYLTADLSVAVPSTTNTPFDVFEYDNAGSLALETVNWTNATTRATALARQNGIWVKSGDATRRYKGTGCTTGVSGQCEDSEANRYLWNYYNRARTFGRCKDSTDSWTYTTAAFRQANGNTANQINVVIGIAEDTQECILSAGGVSATIGVGLYSAIGLDAVNAAISGCIMQPVSIVAPGQVVSTFAIWSGTIPIGKHYLAWLEYSDASGTTTWHGDNGLPSRWQNGMQAKLWK